MSKRIFIAGCSGAGKSTLAVELSRRLGLPLHHIDQLIWEPGWVMAPAPVLEERMAAVLSGPAWVLDGALRRHWAQAIDAADLVLWLDYPTWRCLGRVSKRILSSWRTVCPDMADGCPEQIDLEFLRWIGTWRQTHRPRLAELLQGRLVLRFQDPRALALWLSKLR
jgi:adenylate kinase family enzyme